jgi:hypothetical protein
LRILSITEQCNASNQYRENAEIRYPLPDPSLLLSPTGSQSTGADEETTHAALIHDIGQFLPIEEAKDAQVGMDTHPVGRVGYGMIEEE